MKGGGQAPPPFFWQKVAPNLYIRFPIYVRDVSAGARLKLLVHILQIIW